MASTGGVLVDDIVLEVLRKSQLEAYTDKFVFVFDVRRFDHFSHVRDKDMQDIGMQQPQIRQLREQILKMSREMWNRSDPKQVYVAGDQSTQNQSAIDEKAFIPLDQIKLFEQLGEGSFAVVKRGTWTRSNGQRIDVAVKILRDISPNIMDDLRVEASHLLKLQHSSLIRLYGIVHQPAMMVFELCEGGSLLDRLRDDKKPIPLVSKLHDYCIQIAKALQFLESKHCVHRDVAARNILLAKDENTVKICDFGLMRALKDNEQMYTMAPQKKVPFAWCPPEALRHRKFSHASDVWSYGVTIWELFTFGEEPWVGCRAIDVLKNIDAGERLEKPKYCSERIYQIMNNCWKSNPAERCKFGTIREDLNSAFFLEAVAREGYNSIQPGALILAKGDEVVVVENTGQDWFGQNKKNQQFGTFPRSVVFAQTNQAVAAASAVTPQKVPTAPTIRMRPEPVIQAPPPLPFASKPLNNNTKTSYNDRTSRISMPVAGNDSIISNGNRSEETILIKAPERRDPTFDIRGNVLKPIPIEKAQPPTSSRPILVAPTASGVISMPLPEKFGTSQPHGSTFYVDKPSNEPPRHNNSAGSRLENMGQPSFLIQQKQNIPNNLIPELQSRLNGGSDNMMRPRPASSIGILNNGMENAYNPQINRPFSVVNVPSMPQQPAQIPCLVPTPAPHQPRKSTNQEQNPLQKALADELKGNLSRRPTSSGNDSNGLPRPTQNGAGVQLSQPPALQPQKVQQPVVSQQPVVQKPIQQQTVQARPAQIQPQQVKLPPPSATTAPATTTAASASQVTRPLAPPATENRKVSAPAPIAPIAPTTTTATTSASSVVTRRSTQTISMSEEERRSRIIQDVASALPAPSALLLGSNSTSALPSTTTQTAVKDRPAVAQVKPSQPQPTMPPKKTSEPILSTEVLQPTRVPSAVSAPKPVSQPVPTQQPVRNPSPPVVQTRLADKKPVNPLAQSTNVPLFNITNSSMYPQLNGYPNYGNGYQPYGYGMNYNSGYPGVQGYNPYMSGMGQLALTNQAVNSLPPLVPSENRFSGSAQPLDESAINELLGAQHRQEASRVTPTAPAAIPSAPSAPSAPSTSHHNDLSMADRMEVLYKEADFTERGNCDTMVTHCKGDTELALKLLKQNHLMAIGVANTPDQARRALEARQYDLSAAANLLLG